MKKDKIKELGQVSTPEWIVQDILDTCHYFGNNILNQYILEPSCGDGAFISEIIKRYIHEAKILNKPINEIISGLETFIVGIEIDPIAHQNCIKRLNNIVKNELNLDQIEIKWNIINANTLHIYQQYKQQFDYIVGNPPYVRIHNLDNETRNILKEQFKLIGNTDLYLAFFYMSFEMIKPTGKFGFITPNSFLHNTSYKSFRKYLIQNKIINKLYDFKSHKAFNGYSTYAAITIANFETQSNQSFQYYEYNNNQFEMVNIIEYQSLNENKWILSSKNKENFLIKHNQENIKLEDVFNIQYGIATLRDKIFIGSIIKNIDENLVLFEINKKQILIEKNILKPIIKASRSKNNQYNIEHIIYPYYENKEKVIVLEEENLKQSYPYTYNYLLDNKNELMERDLSNNTKWFEFGRSQGLKNSQKIKIAVNPVFKEKIFYVNLNQEIMVYSGIFITLKEQYTNNEIYFWNLLEKQLQSNNFLQYAFLSSKDMSGGYKNLSTKTIKDFPLNI